MKTPMSRFHIHDELTAPEGSVPVLRGALASGGQLPNFLGVLAGSPAALRAYARFRSELRHGTLTLPTLERIALAVAQHYHSEAGNQMHSRTARQAGLALDEGALAKEWGSPGQRGVGRGRPREGGGLARGAGGHAPAFPPLAGGDAAPAADAPPRGGARGRLDGRADPRGDRRHGDGDLHRHGERRRRGTGGRLLGGLPAAPRGVTTDMPRRYACTP